MVEKCQHTLEFIKDDSTTSENDPGKYSEILYYNKQ